MGNRKMWIAFTSLIILGLLLSGCAGVPAREDTFINSLEGDVGSLDPQTVGAAAFGSRIPYYSFEGLTHWSCQDWHVMPLLAESWENIDPLTWKFTLRQGVKFHNGQPFTSADVQFSYYRIMGVYDPTFPGAGGGAYKALIEEVETPDDYTVIIRTKYPEVSLPSLVAWIWIVPKAYIEEVGDEEFAERPMGTGPYVIKGREIMESITLEAYEDYWNTDPEPGQLGPAKVKNMIYRVIPEEASRVAALKVGEVDAVIAITADTARELEKDPNLRVYYSERNEPGFIMMNWRDEKDPETGEPNPFLDVRVRQAMNYAIDVDALIENYGTGYEYRTTLIGKGAVGYNPDRIIYEYNPEKARQLLAEAGYPNGFSTVFYLVVVTPGFEAMCQYWREVGINVEFEIKTYPALTKALIRKQIYGLAGMTGSFGPDSATGFFKGVVKSDGPYALHSGDERIDELIDKQAQEFDEEKRAKLIDEVVQILWKDAWFVPLYELVFAKAIGAEWDYEHWPTIQSVLLTNVSKK